MHVSIRCEVIGLAIVRTRLYCISPRDCEQFSRERRNGQRKEITSGKFGGFSDCIPAHFRLRAAEKNLRLEGSSFRCGELMRPRDTL
jgi:hypothetical protein